jgi:hypothetical protein
MSSLRQDNLSSLQQQQLQETNRNSATRPSLRAWLRQDRSFLGDRQEIDDPQEEGVDVDDPQEEGMAVGTSEELLPAHVELKAESSKVKAVRVRHAKANQHNAEDHLYRVS